jgi:hypothetical protein
MLKITPKKWQKIGVNKELKGCNFPQLKYRIDAQLFSNSFEGVTWG